MSSDPTKTKRKLWLLGGLALVGVAALGGVLAMGLNVADVVRGGLDLVVQAGPLAVFGGMAVLPLFGVPLLPFVLTAGAAFGPKYGLPLVVVYTLVAVTCNLSLSYVLARKAFRPVLIGVMGWLGYKMPALEGGDATDFVIILRVTPGIPFCVQNYMAGLANVPFVPYFIISCIGAWAYNSAFVVFGDALLHGRGKMVLISVGCLVAIVAVTHMVRRHYAAKKAVV